MSVLIRGMEMPKRGMVVNIYADGRVTNHFDEFGKTIGKAVPVPPHGDLIDRDALMKSESPIGKMMMFGGQYVFTENEIKNAPTIIPAEEGE